MPKKVRNVTNKIIKNMCDKIINKVLTWRAGDQFSQVRYQSRDP